MTEDDNKVTVIRPGDEVQSFNESWEQRIKRRADEELKILRTAKKIAEKFELDILKVREILLSGE